MGGSVASYAVLGAPDLILLTLTELADQVWRVCRAGMLSVVVDADHGYGNALNVMRAVEELEHAGAAGITIEDTLLPQPFDTSGPALVSLAEGTGKMRAAVEARAESGMCILARTSAASINGVDDAVERLRAYQATGVDALFLPGLRTREQLDRIAAAVDLPLVLAAPHESLIDADYLASRGVRICAAGHQPFWAAVQGLYNALRAVRDGALPSELSGVASDELGDTLTGAAIYRRNFEDFARPADGPVSDD